MGVWDYSTTAGNNASVSGQNWAEGQAPSTINDSARKLLADLAEQYQLYGGLLTTAGSANAQTLTPSVAWTAYNDGARLLVQIGNSLTNTGSATLNVSSLGAKTIYRRDGSATLSAGDLVAGSFYELVYDATINGFRLLNAAQSLDDVTSAGSDVASAGTVDLSSASGGIVDVTGTTTITAITLAEGNVRLVRFTGALTLTHGASLVLPGAANITTAAGDWAIFVGDASSVVRCMHYQKVSGGPTVAATASDFQTGTASGKVLTAASVPRFVSSAQTISEAGSLTLAHGLGVTPAFISLFLEATASPEEGWSQGDQVLMSPTGSSSSGTDGNMAVWADATNIYVRFGGLDAATFAPVIVNKSTGAYFQIDITKWKLVVKAIP